MYSSVLTQSRQPRLPLRLVLIGLLLALGLVLVVSWHRSESRRETLMDVTANNANIAAMDVGQIIFLKKNETFTGELRNLKCLQTEDYLRSPAGPCYGVKEACNLMAISMSSQMKQHCLDTLCGACLKAFQAAINVGICQSAYGPRVENFRTRVNDATVLCLQSSLSHPPPAPPLAQATVGSAASATPAAATVGGSVAVTPAATIGGTVAATPAATIGGTVAGATPAATIGGTVAATPAATIGGTVAATPVATIGGTVAGATPAATIGGTVAATPVATLGAAGATPVATVGVAGAVPLATVGGTVAATPAATIGGTVAATPVATLAGAVAGATPVATIGGTVAATPAATIGGAVAAAAGATPVATVAGGALAPTPITAAVLKKYNIPEGLSKEASQVTVAMAEYLLKGSPPGVGPGQPTPAPTLKDNIPQGISKEATAADLNLIKYLQASAPKNAPAKK